MTTAKERLEQAEQRLQEVDGLQYMLEQAAHELANYRQVLERKLAWLGQDGRASAAVPGRSAGTQRMATIQAVPGTQRMVTVTPPVAPPPPAEPPPKPAAVAPPKPAAAAPPKPAAVAPPKPAAVAPPKPAAVAPPKPAAAAPPKPAAAAPPPAAKAKPSQPKLTPPKVTRPSLYRSQPPPEPEPEAEVEAPPHAASAAFEAEDDDGSERRTAPRRKGNPVPVKISDPLTNSEPLDGWVVDRSSGGVRILTDQSYKPGTALTVRPAKAHAGFPWIKIEVRSCSPERGSFSLGCMFQQKPSWAELQGFG